MKLGIKRVLFLAAAAASAAVFVVVTGSRQEESASASVSLAPGNSASTPGTPRPRAVVPPALARTLVIPPQEEPRPSLAASMQARYETTNNYRSFIAQALQDPQGGGRFYAWLAYTRCHPLSYMRLSREASDTPQVALAKEQLELEIARCEGVLDTYGEDMTFYRLLADPRGGPDPLMPPNGRVGFASTTREAARHHLAAAQRTRDPNAISAALEINIDFLAQDWLKDQYDPAHHTLYYAAAAVVGCELRRDCEGVVLNAGRCAVAGVCDFKDYRDFVLAGIPETDRGTYLDALAVLRRSVGAH